MYKVSPKEYSALIEICYDKKQPLFVRGAPGIGKSAIPLQVAQQIAGEKNKKFVLWSDATLEERVNCIKNAKEYFVFSDQRTAQMDTTSLIGIPNMSKTDILENIPYSWIVYFSQADADGMIFFDEINLAPPSIQAITYSIINDRVVSDRRLANDVWVLAAGNRAIDGGCTFSMPKPLLDRFCECELEINFDDWKDWAIKNKVNPFILSYLNFKPSNLLWNPPDEHADEKAVTPRGIVRCSKMIDGMDVFSSQTRGIVAACAGNYFESEFSAFLACNKKFDLNVLFESPEMVKSYEPDIQFAIGASCVQKFIEILKIKEDARKKADIEKYSVTYLRLLYNLNEEISFNSLRMMREYDVKMLKTILKVSMTEFKKISDKFQKYIF